MERYNFIMKTYTAKPSEINKQWHLVDAAGQTLGRLASEVSRLLLGKHKPMYTAHLDTGDFVVVVNAEKVRLTGTKTDSKLYRHHSNYPGGLTTRTFKEQMAKAPTRIIENAVRGMMPKGSLGRAQMKKLKIYVGPQHPHEAQAPQPYVLDPRAGRELAG